MDRKELINRTLLDAEMHKANINKYNERNRVLEAEHRKNNEAERVLMQKRLQQERYEQELRSLNDKHLTRRQAFENENRSHQEQISRYNDVVSNYHNAYGDQSLKGVLDYRR